jgi:uncharacterized protein (TIGR00369 family)
MATLPKLEFTGKPATLRQLREVMRKLHFNRHLGIRLRDVHQDGVTVECPIREDFFNMHDTLHGGVTATLVDVAGGFATFARYGLRPATTVEMKLSYFLPVTGSKVTARSKILRAGKTLCVSLVEVFTGEGKLAAAALITYMLLPPPPTEARVR